MAKLRFVVSLITKENDYQMEQTASANATAKELGVEVEIVYAENDAITQSTQLLKVIQAESSLRPQGIIVEPLGATTFPRVASAAAAAGIGWAVVSRQAEYTAELRKAHRSPIFSVSTNQVEVGRIQGKQVAQLLPRGGSVLYIQGPSVSSVCTERHHGLRETIPANLQFVNLVGDWTKESAYQSVASWMKLMSAHWFRIDLITAQNDAMAMGAKKALKDLASEMDRDVLSKIPAIGCDGVPSTGQAWVRAGELAATVITPPSAGTAIALMTRALETQIPPPEYTFTSAEPFPAIEALKPL
jgi:ABC-type sugar transport system substrate-binding protein